MTKFEKFLKKFGVKLTRDNCGYQYGNFIKWKTGDIKNPSIQSLNDFYNIFKRDIEFSKNGLIDCFEGNNKSFYYEKPFILGIEGGLHRRYSYLFVNYLLKNLISNIKVLVLDQSKYDHIYNSLDKPYMSTFEKIELTNIKDNKDRIVTTKNKNIDYGFFTIYEDIHRDAKSLRKTSLKLLNDLKNFKKYDLILFNYNEESCLEIMSKIVRRVTDPLYFIKFNNKNEKDLNYLRDQTNNLEVLNSDLNFRVNFIIKRNKQIRFIDYWQISRQITGETLPKTENYVPVLKPKVFVDLKKLYREFLKSSKYSGFRDEDYYSTIRTNFLDSV